MAPGRCLCMAARLLSCRLLCQRLDMRPTRPWKETPGHGFMGVWPPAFRAAAARHGAAESRMQPEQGIGSQFGFQSKVCCFKLGASSTDVTRESWRCLIAKGHSDLTTSPVAGASTSRCRRHPTNSPQMAAGWLLLHQQKQEVFSGKKSMMHRQSSTHVISSSLSNGCVKTWVITTRLGQFKNKNDQNRKYGRLFCSFFGAYNISGCEQNSSQLFGVALLIDPSEQLIHHTQHPRKHYLVDRYRCVHRYPYEIDIRPP